MKTLIVYFTWSNNTKKLVDGINADSRIDVLQIKRKVPYSTDYHTCAYVQAKEEYEKKISPEIEEITVDFDQYDRILLFFPIWWYTFPMPIATFAERIKDYKGKVEVFANSYTNDPQYMVNSLRDLKKIAPRVDFTQGLFNKSIKEHIEYLR